MDLSERIGFIGLGTMGKPMAHNLLKAGYTLTVYNRSRAAVDELVAVGATAAGSSAEVAAASDLVITMVPDSPDVQDVVLGESGVLKGAKPGAVVIDMSTISPLVAQEIAKMSRAVGATFLDSPVSGGEPGAIAGTLSIMVGGDKEAFERVRPILETMGKTITYIGPSGSGQITKLCNQILCAVNILAVSEAMTLGKKAGLDLNVMMQAISGGAASSWMLSNLGPKMIARDWAPGFKIDLQQKDLRLAEESAQSLQVPLPGATLARQLFRAVQAEGLGSDGTQAMVKAIEKLAGM
jgi:3-hydroxyisobutyrate dehydrogenase